MRMIVLALLAALPLSAHAAGLRLVDIPADPGGPALTGAVWTPCAEPPGEVRVGPISVPGTRDCPILGEHLPLVVISHGVGGWRFGHHDLAETLADAGFVVAAIDHPLDTGRATDRSHMGSLEVWSSRPADIRRLIDFMLAGWTDHARIDPARIGFYGFSRGGFTGLALIGGNPDFEKFASICVDYPKLRTCAQLGAGERPPTPLVHDPRIRAAVLADPVIGRIFAASNLKDIVVPVQLWASEQGGDGVLPHEVATMAESLPTAPEMHVVGGAAHFAFLSPCGAELRRLAADVCTDPPGFDRAGFHNEMNRAVVAFFQAQLAARS